MIIIKIINESIIYQKVFNLTATLKMERVFDSAPHADCSYNTGPLHPPFQFSMSGVLL